MINMRNRSDLIRFLPSYVGSKRMWVPYLQEFSGRPIVELFAGSAVLSANLASKALIVDYDPIVAKVLQRFDEQIVPEVFTRDDYYHYRSVDNWWQYLYCLQSMSYSGVFRYSKNGYNVPAKGGSDISKNKVNEFYNRPSYEKALERWKELSPDVRNCSYIDITDDEIAALGDDVLVILDPPYGDGEEQKSQAAYNDTASQQKKGEGFDFDEYWARAKELTQKFDVIIFDRKYNLERNGYHIDAVRKMRVNGARPGDVEAMSVQLKDNKHFGSGSDLFDLFSDSDEPIVVE